MVHPADVFTTFTSPVELPDIQDIEKMDRDKSEAIEALQISDHSVKCQRCGNSYRIAEKAIASWRIGRLQRRISHAQAHGVDTNNTDSSWKQDKQELEQLLAEEEKKNFLSRLPLYSSSITHYRFFCSICYDNAYRSRRRKKKARILT